MTPDRILTPSEVAATVLAARLLPVDDAPHRPLTAAAERDAAAAMLARAIRRYSPQLPPAQC